MNFKAHKTWESDRVSLSQLLFIKGFPGAQWLRICLPVQEMQETWV